MVLGIASQDSVESVRQYIEQLGVARQLGADIALNGPVVDGYLCLAYSLTGFKAKTT